MEDCATPAAEDSQDIEMEDGPGPASSLHPPAQLNAISNIPAKRRGGGAPQKLRKKAREELELLDSMSKTLADCNLRLSVSPASTLEQAERDYNRLCGAISRLTCRTAIVLSRKADFRRSLDLFRGCIDDERKSRVAQNVNPVQYDTGLLPRTWLRNHNSLTHPLAYHYETPVNHLLAAGQVAAFIGVVCSVTASLGNNFVNMVMDLISMLLVLVFRD